MGQRMAKDKLIGLENIILLEQEFESFYGHGYGFTSDALHQNEETSPISKLAQSHIAAHGGVFAQYKDFNILNPGWKHTGGRMGMRPLIRDYYARSVGLLFKVQTKDTDMSEFRLEYLKLSIKDRLGEKNLKDSVMAVVSDQHSLLSDETNETGVITVAEIDAVLDKELTEEERRRIKVFPTVWATGEGVSECLDWMIGEINKKRSVEALAQPWKEVAQEVVENSKDGMKVVKGTWKNLLTVLRHVGQKTVTSAA